MQIKRAEKKISKLRCALVGISGSGKTYSALKIATGLGRSICLIDTECGSASLYSDLVEFDTIELGPPFSPERYMQAIKMAEKSNYGCIIIDSLSHAWAGTGGILDIQNSKLQSSTKGSLNSWKEVTPIHNKLIESILHCKSDVICTLRTKTQYEAQENENGKKTLVKIGLSPIQKSDLEYEFTVVFDMTQDNYASSTKDRTGLFKGRCFSITEDTGMELKLWLNNGKSEDDIEKERIIMSEEVIELFNSAIKIGALTKEDEINSFKKEKVNSWDTLPIEKLKIYKDRINEKIKEFDLKMEQESRYLMA